MMNKQETTKSDTFPNPSKRSYQNFDEIIANSEDEKEVYLARLTRKLSITCGARFETARRHKKKHRTSTIAIVILSMYAILFSLIGILKHQAGDQTQFYGILAIFMSSFILAFSLFESSKRYDARSESFLRCAKALEALRDKAILLLHEKKYEFKDIRELDEKYHKILIDYTDNHAMLDYKSHQYVKGKLSGWDEKFYPVLYKFNIWLLPMFAAVSPLIIYGLFCLVALFDMPFEAKKAATNTPVPAIIQPASPDKNTKQQ